MRLISLHILLTTAMVLTGCGQESKITQAYKKAFDTVLVDPKSVEYKNVFVYKDGTACGEVNSKNRMGGYTGFRAFIFNEDGGPDDKILNLGEAENGAHRVDQSRWCTDIFDTREEKAINEKIDNIESPLDTSSGACRSLREDIDLYNKRDQSVKVTDYGLAEMRHREKLKRVDEVCTEAQRMQVNYEKLLIEREAIKNKKY